MLPFASTRLFIFNKSVHYLCFSSTFFITYFSFTVLITFFLGLIRKILVLNLSMKCDLKVINSNYLMILFIYIYIYIFFFFLNILLDLVT